MAGDAGVVGRAAAAVSTREEQATGRVGVVDVTPAQLERWLAAGEAVLVDVREGFEHAAERIPAAEHIPVGRLDPEALRSAHGGKRVVFHCRSGTRSLDAALRCGRDEAYHLAGGILAWKASGRATERSAGAPPIDVMRQVQITAGALVAIGTLLGWTVTPWLLVVPAFVGTGLVFAGATGWCGLARLLALLPWNRCGGVGCAS